ncbi:MAG: RICIN domain-containing protein [Verrucomicrobia bacterium]|nr:RICIN domain-containing protein [Verrucomicrobiota bacterium]
MKRIRILAAGIISLLAASFASAQTMVVIVQVPMGAPKVAGVGKVLTIDATSTAQRVPVVLADYVNTPNQRWTLQTAGGGKYFIYNTADGRAIEATTTDENAPLYAADLNWEDAQQMWRFAPAWGIADRKITSAFNGLCLTHGYLKPDEYAPVSQSSRDVVATGWLVVPVHSVPNFGTFATSLGSYNSDPNWKNLGFRLKRVRNVLRVGFWIWTDSGGPEAAVWEDAKCYAPWDEWQHFFLVDTGTRETYHADAYALGADNEWHYFSSTSQVVGQPVQPERPANP